MANQMRARRLAKAGLPGCFGARHPHCLVADGLFRIAMPAGREQIVTRLEPSPVDTQVLEQGRAQGQIAVLVSFSIDNVNDHALAVDVGDLEPRDLCAAHAGSIKNHQQGALKQIHAGVDQTRDFFLAEDVAMRSANLLLQFTTAARPSGSRSVSVAPRT